MKFLEKIVADLRAQNGDLSHFALVMPGKRPVIFLKKILSEQQYSGILPMFFTIEDAGRRTHQKLVGNTGI